jgi:hypothetical protein
VDSRETKRRAGDLAEGISGVRQVHNQPRVQSGRETESASGASQSQGTSGSMGGSRSRVTETRSSRSERTPSYSRSDDART